MTNARRLLFAALLLAAAAPAAQAEPASPVVVELFTSEGCSSCPPADALLGELAKRPDVLALAFHVDYWNYIGWTDPFASAMATQRQRDYAHRLALRYVYTPEMVVNGATEGVGSERRVIETLVADAARMPMPHPVLGLARTVDGGLAVHVAASATPGAEAATVWLVGFDAVHTTPVGRGENSGRILTEYQIVRTLRSIGNWHGAALDIAVPAAETTDLGEGCAVLLQRGGAGPILTATRLAAK